MDMTPTSRPRHSTAHLPGVAPIISLGLTFALTALIGPSGAEAQSLRGSAASLDRQNAQARIHDFTYLQTPEQIRRFVENGFLVAVGPTADMNIHNVSFPYARPEVRVFLERLSSQYRAACGEKLVVTSLTRPRSHQPPNASSRSVHPTGMAVDLRRSGNANCRNWLESTLMNLEAQGVLEAIYERNPPHYHLAVYPQPYTRHLARITGQDNAMELALANGQQLDRSWVVHRVRRGETLSRIAARYDASTSRVRSENGIRGDRILVGQELRIPVYETVPAGAATVASSSTGGDGVGDAPPTGQEDASGPEEVASAASPPNSGSSASSHRVARGETLWAIARTYGVSEGELRRANGLSGSRILVGQELTLPGAARGPGSTEVAHTVASGETLWSIARRYGVSESQLRAANGINGSRILVGQSLVVPEGGSGSLPVQHTVRSGESLWAIANRHGTTVERLQQANQIQSNRVYPGQTLSVPTSD